MGVMLEAMVAIGVILMVSVGCAVSELARESAVLAKSAVVATAPAEDNQPPWVDDEEPRG